MLWSSLTPSKRCQMSQALDWWGLGRIGELEVPI